MGRFDVIEVIVYATLATLVAVAWAICFMGQLKTKRVSLLSLFVLIAAEAILFWALPFVNRL